MLKRPYDVLFQTSTISSGLTISNISLIEGRNRERYKEEKKETPCKT